MCSVQDGDEMIPVPHRGCEGRNCMKCSEPAVVVIRVNDALCRECFLSYTVHKFRMSFGKSKLIRDKEHVLLAFSGGSCSSAMLHLVQEGKSERAKKKLRFVPILIHIDESVVMKGDPGGVESVIAKLRDTGLPYQVYHLQQIYDTKLIPVEVSTSASDGSSPDGLSVRLGDVNLTASATQQPSTNPDAANVKSGTESLEDLFNAAKTLSAKQALLLNLRLQFLARVAVEVGVNKVLLGDSGTRLSIRMLSDITQGRGAHLSFEMSFADNRREDVTYVRPMREFTTKEISMYNVLNKVEPVFIPNFATKAPSNASIEQLTEQFVTGLQEDFPNTVSTIFRTGEKLDLSDKQDSTEEDRKCSMCRAPLDTDVPQCSALNATIFSQKLCNPKSQSSHHASTSSSKVCCATTKTDCGAGTKPESSHDDNTEASTAESSCCGQGDGSCHTLNTRMSLDELNSTLCYGCRLVVKDMDSHNVLPAYVLENAGKQIRRNQMKESIVDFLIEDS